MMGQVDDTSTHHVSQSATGPRTVPRPVPAMTPSSFTRRDFLQSTGGLAAGLAPLPFRGFHVGGSALLKVGLVGCGGRGTGAAAQALAADPGVVLWAMGDVAPERIERSIAGLTAELTGQGESTDRLQVPADRRFVGLDCARGVIDSGIDVVLLAEPPGFRPHSLRRAVERGLHVFCEKPVAVDPAGCRSIRESCEIARKKRKSIVSGLCYRYHDGRRAIMHEIHAGRIGDVVAMNANYITNGLWLHPRKAEWSDVENMCRNWLYHTWLSGDLIAEQHIHSLDVMAWAMQDKYPVKALGIGGRQVRTREEYGHVYDHFSVIYEWENGVRGFSHARQHDGCKVDVSDHVFGTTGRADIFKHRITGASAWRYQGPDKNMYQNEHDALFAAIRKDEPIDNGDYMVNSTMMAVMGRMSAYTGQQVTWEQAWASKEDLWPKDLKFGPMPTAPVAMPGITKFV